ncbi:MAG TPA: hypothetical protein VI386_25900 [Candidatus Sulfotelmatobacter sp.]
MTTKRDSGNEVRMELKYCERCGGLWLRECGSGLIFCKSCEINVTELPILKKRVQSVKLAEGQRPELDSYRFDASGESIADRRGRGGVA